MIVETVVSYLNNSKCVTGGVIKQRESDPGCHLLFLMQIFFSLSLLSLSLLIPHTVCQKASRSDRGQSRKCGERGKNTTLAITPMELPAQTKHTHTHRHVLGVLQIMLEITVNLRCTYSTSFFYFGLFKVDCIMEVLLLLLLISSIIIIIIHD